MGNPQPLTAGQLRLIGDAKLEAFKILTLPDPGLNQQLIGQLAGEDRGPHRRRGRGSRGARLSEGQDRDHRGSIPA